MHTRICIFFKIYTISHLIITAMLCVPSIINTRSSASGGQGRAQRSIYYAQVRGKRENERRNVILQCPTCIWLADYNKIHRIFKSNHSYHRFRRMLRNARRAAQRENWRRVLRTTCKNLFIMRRVAVKHRISCRKS